MKTKSHTHPVVSSTYSAWQSMKDRCYCKNEPKYKIYGGAGIRVCNRWLNSFENFLDDMGEKPSAELSLDRYPNKIGNYEPGNCRWATMKQQANNRTNNRLLTFSDETKTVSEWADFFGLSRGVITARIDRSGWSVEKALTTPTLNPINNLNFKKV